MEGGKGRGLGNRGGGRVFRFFERMKRWGLVGGILGSKSYLSV